MPTTRTQPPDRVSSLLLRLHAAALAIAVAVIHIVDQGGLPGTKTPGYIQGLYYALEIGAVLTAIVLLAPRFRLRWTMALAVAVGPILGYVLSRGPGLPSYSDDVGNWGETLGVVSLIVEGALFFLALAAMGLARRRTAASSRVSERRLSERRVTQRRVTQM